MNIKRYLFVLMFSTLFLFACSNNADLNVNTTANSGTVYATNVSLNLNSLNYYVGDSINLNTINVSVSPTNSTVKPSFSVDNLAVASINNNILTFISAGTVNLTASVLSDVNTYKTATVTIFVTETPVYATSVSIFNNNVIVNLDETRVNILMLTPNTYNKNIKVEYLNGGIVNYNYNSGVITPLNVGEEVVTIIVYKSETKTISTSFNVVVTNNVYATSLNSFSINNKEMPNSITLFTKESGRLSCNVLPANYNMETTYFCSNNLISVSNSGEFVVGNTVGNCQLTCGVNTIEGMIYKTIDVTILSIPTTINFDIKLNNENVDCLYTGVTYNAYISSNLANYNLVTFTNCNYNYVSDNLFKILVSNAGETEIKVAYNIYSFIGTYTIYGAQTFNVYNVVTDINFGLYNNLELIPNNNCYTLYLPNSNYVLDAINNNQNICANIVLSSKNINTLPNCLNLSLVGNSVKLENNILTAISLGESKLIITSNDIGNFYKEILINVVPLEATNIKVDSNLVNLYLNGDTSKPSSFELNYVVEPYYAYNNLVSVSCNSDVVKIDNGIVTALKAGSAVITLTCGNVTTNVDVVVNYVPTHISVLINNSNVNNKDVINLNTNETYYLSVYVYSNLEVLDNEIRYYLNSVEYNASSINKLMFTEEGNYVLTLKSGNLSFNLTLNVKLVNPITSVNFLTEELNVNMFETLTSELNYQIEKLYPTKEHSSNLEFISSNENVVKVNGTTLTFVSAGTATISAVVDNVVKDTITINVISKEVNYISTISEFLAISANPSANYVVTNNLDFSGFTSLDSFNFSGEIDFNGYTITNLTTPLFNYVTEGAVVTNLSVGGSVNLDVNNYYNSSTNSGAYFAFIASVNDGTISNITFNNFTFNLTNVSLISSTTLSLIATSNNGLISNVLLNNFEFNANFESSKVSGVIFSGLTYANSGTINGVSGSATYSGFTRIAGVALNNYSNILNITLAQTFNCTQTKHQIGALVYKCSIVNSVVPSITNVNLTNTVVNNTTLTFAGFVYSADNLQVENIKLNNSFSGTFNGSTTFLVYYTKPSNVENISSFEILSNLSFNNYA